MICLSKKAGCGVRRLFGVALLLLPTTTFAAAVVPFTLSGSLSTDDDASSGAVPLNLDGASGINFFGQSFTSVYVNSNGNVTFQLPLSQFNPTSLATGVGLPLIAPFFADVDIMGSGAITYGNATYNGRAAFVADWLNVGYFDANTNKLNTFQMILTDRSDTGAGNFDIEFNYDRIEWETGDAGGRNGVGGVSAAAGFSNGVSGAGNMYYQLPGSLVNGAFLAGGLDSLIANSLNSTTPGRYDFDLRNGTLSTSTPEPISLGLLAAGIAGLFVCKKRLTRR